MKKKKKKKKKPIKIIKQLYVVNNEKLIPFEIYIYNERRKIEMIMHFLCNATTKIFKLIKGTLEFNLISSSIIIIIIVLRKKKESEFFL